MNNPTAPCGHCGHNKAAHSNGLGMCIGATCRCSRFMKETPKSRQVKAMSRALAVVIEMLEEWPTDDEKGRSIRIGSPSLNEKNNMIAQCRKALGTI